ncbi:MAG: Gfo/Idh/MocA family oxidoreductase [bacterium]|nr:Gfo/Idh/MocA family oxidoreductase [bacterium]
MITIPSPKILLVGTGHMAKAYAQVLKAVKKDFFTVGRGDQSASAFEQATGRPVARGGLKNWLTENTDQVPSTAIVAVDEEQLSPSARLLIQHGVKSILLEKPGGLNRPDLEKTQRIAEKKKARVFVAYNRRFYASTLKAKEIIKKDGGVISFNFDFTERSSLIEKSNKPTLVKKEWLLANSSHVLDLAFFLGGKPKKINSYLAGGLSWHPRASVYAGAGISQSKALFSYHANWASAGRWSVEIMTSKHKLIFRPLEKLHIQKTGSMDIEEVKINDQLDIKFKPGLYRLVESFLTSQNNLPSIIEQVKNLKYYNLIDGK